MTEYMRDMVKIDEEKCDGCGLCIPNCAEGAIQIIDGKAKLIADNLCDGLGNCLGVCPQGAITVEKRSAVAFDEAAVEDHLSSLKQDEGDLASQVASGENQSKPSMACGCPGTMARQLSMSESSACAAGPGEIKSSGASQLGHWPVQLTLLPPKGPMWQNADVLIAADCVPAAMPDFHDRLLKGHSVAIGCPKLDDLASYESKMTAIFKLNPIKSVTVAHMEVPCCSGIVVAVRNALAKAGKSSLKFTDVMVSVEGKVM